MDFPETFLSFLEENGISPSIYSKKLPRFILAFQTAHQHKPSEEELFSEFPTARRLEWIDGFYVLPGEEPVAHTSLYQSGRIVCLDPSSMLAVMNLSLSPGAHVLDLCCAPGTKLSLIHSQVCVLGAKIGSVTGVDVSKERLGAAVALCKRFRLNRVRLFALDGTLFDAPVHIVCTSPEERVKGCRNFQCTYAHAGQVMPFFATTSVRKYPSRLDGLYDAVLVDAQCTHDGSVKHIQKHIENGWKEHNPYHYSREGLGVLYELQLALLENGFKQLRPGGLLVYSTCSLSRNQNEEIILKFIQNHQDANDVAVEEPIGPQKWKCPLDSQRYVMRVPPSEETGGALFICRIKKIANC